MTSYTRTITATQGTATGMTRGFQRVVSAKVGTLGLVISPRIVMVLSDPFLTIRLFLLTLKLLRPKMLSPAQLLSILDILGSSYRTSDLQATASTLTTIGTQIYGDGATVFGTGNENFILKMASAADMMLASAQPDAVNKAIYQPFFTALASYLASQGGASYSTLDTYLSTLNGTGGTPYTALVSPNTAYLQWLAFSKQPTLLMQPGNVYAPATTFGTGTVGAGAAITFGAGGVIRTVSDTVAGLQGFAPAKGVRAQITTLINGTLTLTLTGNGWSSTGAPVTGRTWTAVVDNAAVGAIIAFTPTAAGDRLSQVTGVTGAGTATAGAFSLPSTTERAAP